MHARPQGATASSLCHATYARTTPVLAGRACIAHAVPSVSCSNRCRVYTADTQRRPAGTSLPSATPHLLQAPSASWVQANYCAIRGIIAQDVQHVHDCQVRSSLLRPINAVGGHIQERRSAHAEYLKTACVHRRTIRSAENSTWPSLSLSQNGYGDGARMKSSTLSWASRNGFRLQPLAPTIPKNSSNSPSLASRVCSFSFAVILGRTALFLNHCNAR